MFTNLFTINLTTMLAAAISMLSMGGFARPVYAGCCPSHGSTQQGGGHDHSAGVGHQAAGSPTTQQDGGHSGHDHGAGSQPAANAQAALRPPHGGQIARNETLALEVVYRPQEIRVYAYDPALQPASVKDAGGELAMQVEGHAEFHRAPLRYVASPPGSREQDYLAAGVNLSNVRDGGMKVWFKLDNLPRSDRRQPVVFNQTFALSQPHVALAALVEDDREGIARQKVCPVMGGALGSMGEPVKLLVDNHALYLCCRGCVRKVQEAPDTYLAKVRQGHGGVRQGHGSH